MPRWPRNSRQKRCLHCSHLKRISGASAHGRHRPPSLCGRRCTQNETHKNDVVATMVRASPRTLYRACRRDFASMLIEVNVWSSLVTNVPLAENDKAIAQEIESQAGSNTRQGRNVYRRWTFLQNRGGEIQRDAIVYGHPQS